jgi:hypothetical protein
MNKFPQFSQTGPRQQLTQTPYSFCKQPQLISKTLNIGHGFTSGSVILELFELFWALQYNRWTDLMEQVLNQELYI